MWPLLLASALGGDLRVEVGRHLVRVQLDGSYLPFETDTRVAHGEAVGAHEVHIRSLFGRPLAKATVDLPAHGAVVLRYDGTTLEALPAPAPRQFTIPDDATRLPVEDGLVYAELVLGTTPVRAVVDTGATYTSLCPALADEAGFTPARELTVVSGENVHQTRMTGALASVEAFGTAQSGVRAVHTESCDHPAVGLELLARYNAIFHDESLAVWSGEAIAHTSAPLVRADTGIYLIEVGSPGEEVRLGVDTGMHTTALSPQAAARLGAVRTDETMRIHTTSGDVTLAVGTVPALTVAEHTLHDVRVLLLTESSPYADGWLGLNALRAYQLWVSPAGAWLIPPTRKSQATSGIPEE